MTIIIDSFDMHYSKICWKLQERYICRFVCLYWVYFDGCWRCPVRCSTTSVFSTTSQTLIG